MIPTGNPYAAAGVPDDAPGRAFRRETNGRIYYGVDQLRQAWEWYRRGWWAAQVPSTVARYESALRAIWEHAQDHGLTDVPEFAAAGQVLDELSTPGSDTAAPPAKPREVVDPIGCDTRCTYCDDGSWCYCHLPPCAIEASDDEETP